MGGTKAIRAMFRKAIAFPSPIMQCCGLVSSFWLLIPLDVPLCSGKPDMYIK